ncbi:MAG: NAD(P)-binding domain-containing protein [Actinomycetota bacterium]|nr:NAD(P)-binding domain-containing protein [Actinomycetota bacterium]MDQ2956173.1 NAD(P)-binding domain-containing protein [Actinomycetota bacterium]
MTTLQAPTDLRDKVCVIGAGSAGITMCRALVVREIAFDCYERGPAIGGLWRYTQGSCGYPSLFANTSKSVMQYPSYPMPDDYPEYPHHTQVARYFDDYVEHFGLAQHIRFDTEVTRVEPAAGGGWAVTLGDGSTRLYRAVLVASGGRHGVPVRGQFDGTFTGRELHAFDYDGPAEFAGKKVVILGLGATSADIATEVSRVAEATYLSVRTGHYVVPKILEGRPIDKLTPLMKKLSVEQRRPLLSLMLKLVHGNMTAYGLPAPPYKPGQGPLISTSEFLPAIVHGRIAPKPVIESVQGQTVRFADGQSVEADVIVHCTGYRIAFPFLDDALVGAGDDAPPLYQLVAPPETEGLYFIGLLHSMMSLMPLAEFQSEWVGDLLTGAVRLPSRGQMWSEIRRSRRRQDKRFYDSSGHLLVDPNEYQRLIEAERRTYATTDRTGAGLATAKKG